MRSWLFLMLLFSAESHAEYFLKFSASGATRGSGGLASDPGAWLYVSIVTSTGGDGKVHWPGSGVGSEISYYYYRKSGSGTTTYNHFTSNEDDQLHFYYADVPRSVTIKTVDGSQKTVITEGDAPVRFSNAPSFSFEDGLLVSPGASYYRHQIVPNPVIEYQKIYVSAYEKMSAYPLGTDAQCNVGWTYMKGKITVKQPFLTGGLCAHWTPYAEPLSHVVRFE